MVTSSHGADVISDRVRFFIMAVLILSLTLLLTACEKAEQEAKEEQPEEQTAMPVAAMPALPAVISFNKAALYPEGVDYDVQRNRFLVTSMHEGTVGSVSPDGQYQPLFQDSRMVSAVGLRIDSQRDRVLVCNSDPGVSLHTDKTTQGKLAGLAVFQLSTGKLIKYLDLGGLSSGGNHFCNDIAVDDDGTAYATDSFSPIIYKISSDYKASIFLQNDRFNGEGFNLNGIVVREDYLLVAKYNEGVLFKVPLNDPENFSQVNIPDKFPGADGLLWTDDGSLVVIANQQTNKVFKLTSVDDWTSATVATSVDTGQVFATTGVAIHHDIYVLYAMLHVLFNPETKEHINTFEIHKQAL